jgi:chitodextrinase
VSGRVRIWSVLIGSAVVLALLFAAGGSAAAAQARLIPTASVGSSGSLARVTVADKTAPSTPTNLHTTQVTSGSVSLAWNASTDPDNASSTLRYRVLRGGTVIHTTSAGVTSFTDSGLKAATKYSYTVVAIDPAGNASAPSSALQVTTATADTTAPTAPTNLVVTANSTSSITVSWKASTDTDNTSSSLTYKLYRYTGLIATLAGTSPLSFTDSGLQSGTSASYYVVALDPAGNRSPSSTTVWATTASSPTTVANWPMDEASGATTMDDSSGHGNNGTLTNVKAGVPGFTGRGYSLTPNAYVTVPSSSSLNPGYRDISITLHFKTSSLPSSGDFDLLRKGASPGGTEYKIELLQTGQINCSFHGTNGVGVQSTGASLANGAWHTVTCARTDWRTASLTVDGTHYTHTNGPIGSIAPTQNLYLGANPVAGNDYYKGSLDDATIREG